MRNPPLRISNDRYDLDVLSGSMGIVGVGDPNGNSADILCSGPNGVHYGILCAYMQRHESIKEEGMHIYEGVPPVVDRVSRICASIYRQ